MFRKSLNRKTCFTKKKARARKHLKVFIVLAVLAAGIIFGIFKFVRGTSRTYNISFSQAEVFLLYRLGIYRDDLARKYSHAKFDNSLAQYTSEQVYSVRVDEYREGEYLNFTCSCIYNILAEGGEYIRFELKKRGTEKTRITVDYSERFWGPFAPLGFWNPGIVRERDIHNEIWGRYFN